MEPGKKIKENDYPVPAFVPEKIPEPEPKREPVPA